MRFTLAGKRMPLFSQHPCTLPLSTLPGRLYLPKNMPYLCGFGGGKNRFFGICLLLQILCDVEGIAIRNLDDLAGEEIGKGRWGETY